MYFHLQLGCSQEWLICMTHFAITVKGKWKVVPVRSIKAHRWCRGIARPIPHLGSRWSWVVKFLPQLLYPWHPSNSLSFSGVISTVGSSVFVEPPFSSGPLIEIIVHCLSLVLSHFYVLVYVRNEYWLELDSDASCSATLCMPHQQDPHCSIRIECGTRVVRGVVKRLLDG